MPGPVQLRGVAKAWEALSQQREEEKKEGRERER